MKHGSGTHNEHMERTTSYGALQPVLDRLLEGHRRASSAINLVPSENRISPLAKLPINSDFYNRYFFNPALDPDFWEFRGGEDVAGIEASMLTDLGLLANAQFVNARPISGMSAMMMAMGAFGGTPGQTIISIDIASGGHYATADMARRLGYKAVTVPARRGRVDEYAMTQLLRNKMPSLVYLDLQNSRHLLDVQQIASLIAHHSPHTILHVDCSHTLGLILGGAIENPLDLGADSMGGSTHKSFPGPHKGVLFTRSAELSERLTVAQMTMLSSHHFGETLALALTAIEFRHFGSEYAKQVVSNARLLADSLAQSGFDVATDEDGHTTSTHQVWVKIGDGKETRELSQKLYDQGIRVNIQSDLPEMTGSALRLGINELTFLGGREDAILALAAEFRHARAGTKRDGMGSLRVGQLCGPPFHFVEPLSGWTANTL